MKAKPHLEQSMQEEQIRKALNTHWHASAAGDANAEHDIYDDDAVCDYPQSGERILALRSHHPGKQDLQAASPEDCSPYLGLSLSVALRWTLQRQFGIHNHLPCGMKPGLPVFTTSLNLCLV